MRTEVELFHMEGRIERWVRFGRVVEERILDRRRRILGFDPGAVFALVRWQAGEHGTAVSRIDILRAVGAGDGFTTVPFVAPGAEVLLHIQGWPKVERVLLAIDAVEALGIAPEDAAPDHWRHVNNRLAAGLPPRLYDRARHQAWLQRRSLGR
jgi:hypothetical protein